MMTIAEIVVRPNPNHSNKTQHTPHNLTLAEDLKYGEAKKEVSND